MKFLYIFINIFIVIEMIYRDYTIQFAKRLIYKWNMYKMSKVKV